MTKTVLRPPFLPAGCCGQNPPLSRQDCFLLWIHVRLGTTASYEVWTCAVLVPTAISQQLVFPVPASKLGISAATCLHLSRPSWTPPTLKTKSRTSASSHSFLNSPSHHSPWVLTSIICTVSSKHSANFVLSCKRPYSRSRHFQLAINPPGFRIILCAIELSIKVILTIPYISRCLWPWSLSMDQTHIETNTVPEGFSKHHFRSSTILCPWKLR